MTDYFDIAFTPAILELQEQKGSRGLYATAGPDNPTDDPAADPSTPGFDLANVEPDGFHTLDPSEVEMATTRDSFYMATVSETGWPYLQHRGGDSGFVKMIDGHTIGWVERNGNRQYLGTGNITANGRISIFLIDYPSRTRLKLYGRATYHPDPSPELITALGADGVRNDGAITVEILATNWNCPKFITPRFTEAQVSGAVGQLQARIEELEGQLAQLET